MVVIVVQHWNHLSDTELYTQMVRMAKFMRYILYHSKRTILKCEECYE